MVTQKLIAVYPLTRTYSISPDSLHQICAAAGLVAGDPSDAFITQYWNEYTWSYRDDIPDPGDIPGIVPLEWDNDPGETDYDWAWLKLSDYPLAR